MRHSIAVAGSALAAVLGTVLLAPSAWAMLPPPEPTGAGGSAATDSVAGGIAAWQVVAIALIAAAIGAVGSFYAQRTHRQSETSGSMSIA